MPNVCVKWRGTNYNIEINKDIETFRNELSKLTNVLPERMKLVMKGKTLATDGQFSEDDIKYLYSSRSQIVMFGEVTAIQLDDKNHDPSNIDASLDSNDSAYEPVESFRTPVGLVNLGNNCYMNSVLQSLYTVISSLKIDKSLTFAKNQDTILVLSLMELFEKMQSAKEPIVNKQFFYDVHYRYPFFAEKDQNGNFLQHDSNEFFIQIMNSLKSVINYKDKNFIKQFFMGRFKKNIKQVFENDSAKEKNQDNQSKDQAKSTQQVDKSTKEDAKECKKGDSEENKESFEDFMYIPILLLERCPGLQSAVGDSLKSTFQKYSQQTQTDTSFEIHTKFDRLPSFLMINYLRFQYKDQAKKNCKIFRKLSFPFQLDLYEYCTDELKKKFDVYRKKKAEIENSNDGYNGDDNDVYQPIGMSDDIGCNNTGIYSLKAIITHKGRTTDSGHYVAWVKRSSHWFKCDDANIDPVSESDVLALAGGADSHLSYMLFYGPTNLQDNGIFHLER